MSGEGREEAESKHRDSGSVVLSLKLWELGAQKAGGSVLTVSSDRSKFQDLHVFLQNLVDGFTSIFPDERVCPETLGNVLRPLELWSRQAFQGVTRTSK